MIVSPIKAAALVATILLTGCSTRFMPVEPVEIAIVPKEVVGQFVTTTSSAEPFKTRFDDYFAEHRSMLLTQSITIEWRGIRGRDMADYAKDKLLRAGIDPTMLSLQENARSDAVMSIRYRHHEVVTTNCVPYTSTPITPITGNCYVENSRFQSMVNPEKMLRKNTVNKAPNDQPDTIVMQ